MFSVNTRHRRYVWTQNVALLYRPHRSEMSVTSRNDRRERKSEKFIRLMCLTDTRVPQCGTREM